MRDFAKMISVLFVACGLAAGSLAVVNAVTRDPIARHGKVQKDTALREVAGEADEFVAVTPDKVWEVVRQGRKEGLVFMTQAQGYSGPITLAFGTDASGALTGLKIINQTETPGLGAKIATPQFRDQFKGKRLGELVLKKDDAANGRIDAITGATISSRVVTNAVRATLESFNKEKGGETAALKGNDPANGGTAGNTGATGRWPGVTNAAESAPGSIGSEKTGETK